MRPSAPGSTPTDTLFPDATRFRTNRAVRLFNCCDEPGSHAGLDPSPRFYAFPNFGYRLIDGLTRLRRQMLLSIRLQFGRHGYVPRSLSQSCHVTGARRCIENQIGRESCRERVCRYVLIQVVAVSVKKH